MNVLIPFYDVNDLDFYLHLVKSLRKFCSEVYIAYVSGEVQHSWKREFSFYRLGLPKIMGNKSLQLFLFAGKVYEQFKSMNIDLVFALSELWTLEFSYYCFRKLGIPFVVWVRGNHRRVREIRRVNFFKRFIANYLEVKYLNHAAFVIPNCMSLYKKLFDWGVNEKKITKPVHNGVNTNIFKPMNVPRSNNFTVGYAGRICPEKRVAEFLKIAKRMKDVKFVIVGSKAMDIKFPENVEYLGRFSFEQMPKFYNMVDLVTLPSLTEGFPSVILEAYACGKPVLAAKEAFPEELKVFGAVTSLHEFEIKIRELQRADLERIGKEARIYVRRNFRWEKFAKGLKTYFEKAKLICGSNRMAQEKKKNNVKT